MDNCPARDLQDARPIADKLVALISNEDRYLRELIDLPGATGSQPARALP